MMYIDDICISLIYEGDPGVGGPTGSLVSSMVRALETKRAPFWGLSIETSWIAFRDWGP